MAEEGKYPGADAAGSVGAIGPAAISLAPRAAAHKERVAAKAEAFLEKQAALSDRQSVQVELQAEELRRELRLHHWSLRNDHVSGPHLADPLEMWGEALMQKNRSDLALAKFAEANDDAPNWGRLHLKWGEALMYVERRDEAQKQFELVSHLDLSAADKAALARWKAKHV